MYIIYRLLIQCCMFTKIDNNLHKVFFYLFPLGCERANQKNTVLYKANHWPYYS